MKKNYPLYLGGGGTAAMQSSLIKHSVCTTARCANLCSVPISGLHPKSRWVPAIANDVKRRSLGTGQGHNRMHSVGANYSDVIKLRLIQEILQLTHFSSQNWSASLFHPVRMKCTGKYFFSCLNLSLFLTDNKRLSVK